MARGNGKQAQQAVRGSALSAYVKKSGNDGGSSGVPKYVADWGAIDASLIATSVVACNAAGGSLLFGHTRDETSYSIVVFYGGDKNSYYFGANADGVLALQTFLYGLCQVHDEPADEPEGGQNPLI